MRKIIGTIGATIMVAAAMAASATPASAAGKVGEGFGDGSVRSISISTPSLSLD
jgi:hypothetical protein